MRSAADGNDVGFAVAIQIAGLQVLDCYAAWVDKRSLPRLAAFLRIKNSHAALGGLALIVANADYQLLVGVVVDFSVGVEIGSSAPDCCSFGIFVSGRTTDAVCMGSVPVVVGRHERP